MNGQATNYPHLRNSLATQYAELGDEALDAVVAEIYGPGITAEDVESFWNDLGRGFKTIAGGAGHLAQQAAPVLGHALPGIAQGALTGASVGGPFGAIAGALAGGAGGILSQSKNPTLRGIGGAVGGVSKLASGVTGGGALGGLTNIALGAFGKGGGPAGALGNIAGTALGALQGHGGLGQFAGTLAPQLAGALGAGASGGSANALLGLFSRPETLRALQAAAMGQFGRATIPIGTQAVPVGSIISAIGTLAGRAAGEAESAGEALPGYFFDQSGELAVDPADSDSRTNALLTYFALTTPPRVVVVQPSNPERSGDSEYIEAEYSEADAEHDEWLMSEAWESAEYEEQDESYA